METTLRAGDTEAFRARRLFLVMVGVALVLLTLPGVGRAAPCPNEALRVGFSSALPDCRAYELISPSVTNGRSFVGPSYFQFSGSGNLFPTEPTTAAGSSVLFMTVNAPLRESEGATGTLDVYEAARSVSGWEIIRRLSPSGPEAILPLGGGVSADHRYTFTHVAPFLGTRPGGSLATEGSAEYLGAPDGSFELVGVGSLGSERLAQGRYISEDGQHVIFSTGHSFSGSRECSGSGVKCLVLKLEPDAPPTGTGAVYDRAPDGPTQVVSLLPGNLPAAAGDDAVYEGASADGSTIAFTIAGTLYVRVDNTETLEVTGSLAVFAGLSKDGRYLFYVSGGSGESGNIHRVDTQTAGDVSVNSTADAEVVNVSADGSHVYFISESQIGGEGIAGQPNLYAWSGGTTGYVATVAPSDLERTSGGENGSPNLTNWTDWAVSPKNDPSDSPEKGPGGESSRTTPDGSVLIFESKAQLTSYDNEGHTAIYRWDDVTKSLACVSCNPLGSPASADAQLQNLGLVRPLIVLHNLSDDGSRVFFETTETLVPEDVDGGVNDIYQWHEEGGDASLHLISSGQSTEYQPLKQQSLLQPSPNVIFGITPSGSDVIFLSQDELIPGAGSGGAPALYDARIDGGFPAPAAIRNCQEEECKPPAEPPPFLAAPRSEQTTGAGNVTPPKPRKPHCHRGTKKHKKSRHCRKRHAKPQPRKATSPSDPLITAQPSRQAAPQAGEAVSSAGAEEPASVKGENRTTSAATLAASEFDFGIESASADLSSPIAGEHPDFTTELNLTHFFDSSSRPQADARTEEVEVSLPPGLVGNPNAIERCETGELLAFANCPLDSQVGISNVLVAGLGRIIVPIYNLEPVHPEREIARFGFYAGFVPVFIDVEVRTASDYGVTAIVRRSPGQAAILEADTIFWGNPADPAHDPQRLNADEAIKCASSPVTIGTACEAPEGKRKSGLDPEATVFMTNPSACQKQSVGFAVRSYQLPGQVFSETVPVDTIKGCEGLPFEPTFSAQPTSPVAGAPTGLTTTLVLPQVEDPSLQGTSTMREARVTLPEGMTIAAGAADGLAACSEAQVGYHEEVDAVCLDASKLGSATITSPSLPIPLQGAIYQRTPAPGRLFGLWLVADELGLHVKLPGEIEPDPDTGQLTAVFRDLPQVPVEEIELNVWGGPRAPLKNPDSCGTYLTSYTFTPHSKDPAVSGQSQMTIDQGCGAGGFSPQLHVGVANPVAGAFSPMIVDITRDDGEQNLGALQVTVPPGELAKIAGVSLCSDAQASSGSCPTDSKIGSLTAAVGPGPQPLWIPQSGKSPTAVYLAGPYKGAPFSVVTAVPAQAGPFDLGMITVRSALDVDPTTGQATVKSDPLPQFIEGVAAIYRRVYISVDRPGFSLNPTNCSELRATSAITSVGGQRATPSSRFQVDGCAALGYKPKLTLKLKGGVKRGGFPGVRSTLVPRAGDANTARAVVLLPPSLQIENAHIRTPCTRVQFNANACPPGSILGEARAYSPLLDAPLEGPVYFRSNGGERELPDIVADLDGQFRIILVGFIDSSKLRIRTTFANVPDAPVSRFELNLAGGKRGLLVSNRNMCRHKQRAELNMNGQNGRVLNSRLLVPVSGCGKKKKVENVFIGSAAKEDSGL
jgi:hypothetical protein